MRAKSWKPLRAVCLLGLGGLAFLLVTATSTRLESVSSSTTLPLPSFTDITSQAGLNYKTIRGDAVTEYMIDETGQGACFFDYNNDGYQDIFLVNGTSRKLEAANHSPHDYLLRNNGDGTFTDVTLFAHLGDSGWHSGCAVGDYNNDGYLDLFVTNFGPNKLYRNNGDGTFTEVAEAAGVAGPNWGFPKWSMGAAFGDYDNDGYVDLIVTNYLKTDPQHPGPRPSDPKPCKERGVPWPCPPGVFEGEQSILYHNNGNGTFTDVTRPAGIWRKVPGRGFGAVFGDFNNDNRQDIYQVNDAGESFYYINNGDGTFTDSTYESGLAVDAAGNVQATMGVTVGDYDNDGLLDIFRSNWVEQSSTLFRNRGGHTFEDKTQTFSLGDLGWDYCGWGTGFFDFDNDGWLDLWISYGETTEALEKATPPNPFAQPSFLLRNLDGKKLVDVSKAVGLRKLKAQVSRGAAFADIDNDGDIDVLVTNKNDYPRLLRNDGGNTRNWLTIRTEGVNSNRAGIGARVTVTAGGMRRIFEVRSSESFLSGNDLRVHVGMGEIKEAELVEVRWPSGQVDKYPHVESNHFYLAREGSWVKPDPLVRSLGASTQEKGTAK